MSSYTRKSPQKQQHELSVEEEEKELVDETMLANIDFSDVLDLDPALESSYKTYFEIEVPVIVKY